MCEGGLVQQRRRRHARQPTLPCRLCAQQGLSSLEMQPGRRPAWMWLGAQQSFHGCYRLSWNDGAPLLLHRRCCLQGQACECGARIFVQV